MIGAQQSSRIGELDGLRGIAALAVVLFHYTVKAPEMVPGLQTAGLGFVPGMYGVHLFFAISGFVIFMTLERTRRPLDFVVSRFARLFPTYWAAILATCAIIAALGPALLAQPAPVIAINLTMLQGFLYLPSVDGAYWSLGVELAFYGCMLGLWRAGLLCRIETVLCLWIALKLVWWSLPFLPSRIELLLVLRYIPFFAIGIAAYRVWAGERRWREQLPALLTALLAAKIADGWIDGLVALACTILFALLAERRLSWLGHPGLLWLGALSYPLYLVHQNIGYAVMQQVEAQGGAPALATGAALFAVFLLALAIHKAIEQPSLAAIRGAWRRSAVRSPD
ncbi:MAG: acyltransferase [Novosphingobium sp.]|uniref:acyltransferase family protein n=1 Tax=Novosphingobium sp. TaxID=1874826 RepID=UPI0026327F06|nr:acyltransferase [Novosphingobium sp.]MCP5388023.1 acyltransferase [Novosphingobium sp.]